MEQIGVIGTQQADPALSFPPLSLRRQDAPRLNNPNPLVQGFITRRLGDHDGAFPRGLTAADDTTDPMASYRPAISKGAPPQPKVSVSLSGVEETMLLTLVARARDAAQLRSILRDSFAVEALSRLDYAPQQALADGAVLALGPLRALQLDLWTAEFLSAHLEATVLHLACGLDSRAQRLAWGPGVRWYDVDMPGVVALRKKLLPPPAGDSYHLVAASVVETRWLEAVPADRPTVVVMEGLLPYLHAAETRQLLQAICQRFPSGQLLFDVVGTCFVRLQALIAGLRETGAEVKFGLDLHHEKDIQQAHPKPILDKLLRFWELPGREGLPWLVRLLFWLCGRLPGLSALVTVLRCEF